MSLWVSELLYFQVFEGPQLTAPMLQEAADLFSEHYGVWSSKVSEHASHHISGNRVRISPRRLRTALLPDGGRACSYVRAMMDGALIGHAFACRWRSSPRASSSCTGTDSGRNVCWVTQLVVHNQFRCESIATAMLEKLRRPDDEIVGIASSHAAACMAAASAFGGESEADESWRDKMADALPGGIRNVRQCFIRENARTVMQTSPIPYIRNAVLRGSLFDDAVPVVVWGDIDCVVCLADTGFFVSHDEPREALIWLRDERGGWPLGGLLEGHEFVLVMEATSTPQRSVEELSLTELSLAERPTSREGPGASWEHAGSRNASFCSS